MCAMNSNWFECKTVRCLIVSWRRKGISAWQSHNGLQLFLDGVARDQTRIQLQIWGVTWSMLWTRDACIVWWKFFARNSRKILLSQDWVVSSNQSMCTYPCRYLNFYPDFFYTGQSSDIFLHPQNRPFWQGCVVFLFMCCAGVTLSKPSQQSVYTFRKEKLSPAIISPPVFSIKKVCLTPQ